MWTVANHSIALLVAALAIGILTAWWRSRGRAGGGGDA